MYNKKIFFAAFFILSTIQLSVSQNNTNSPYTRYGYGDITESTATELRGMGGVSLANRSKNTINSLNPASYSSVDSLTFMFDIAGGARYSRFSDKSTSSKTFNSNLEYITIRFPLAKWLGFSAGLQPYSFVGYNFSQSDSISMPVAAGEDAKNIHYTQLFNGTGGFSQLYTGLSANLLNHVSIGVNAYYLFGDASNYRNLIFSNTTDYTSTVYNNNTHASDFRLRYGIQVYNTFNKKHNVTLGAIYENKTNLNGEFSATLNDTVLTSEKRFELPQTFGVGLNYIYDNQLTVGVDYKTQAWKNALYMGKTDSLVNVSQLSLGAEYIPNPRGRKYTDRIRYRIGLNTSNPYYKLGTKKQPNNFVFSLGIGFPVHNEKTMINTSLEYGKIGSGSLLREDYLKLTFSASINEFWFMKRKL